MGERLRQGLRQGAGQAGENLALHLAGQIGARAPRGQKKLRNAGVALVGHDSSMTKPWLGPQGNRRIKVSSLSRLQPPRLLPGGGGGSSFSNRMESRRLADALGSSGKSGSDAAFPATS